MQPAALLSVSNRQGLIEFAQGLSELGYVLLGTKGTKIYLEQHGLKVESIETYTGQNEILDGRVKTLHPRIHAGLLAKRDNQLHLQQLNENSIYQIDVAAINLYPFVEGLKSDKANSLTDMVELIDIGGPTMIRAAAKNFAAVYAVIDPDDYSAVLESLASHDKQQSAKFRQNLAVKVFTALAAYNLEIARYLSSQISEDQTNDSFLSEVSGHVLKRKQTLRYGENPHQQAAYYSEIHNFQESAWQQLQGKELSYNNLLDLDAAARIIASIKTEQAAVAIMKHLNPCGVALDNNLLTALKAAKLGDPRSHFGGIIACNREVDVEFASEIAQDFAEVIVAPSYANEALNILSTKKNLRLIVLHNLPKQAYELRSIMGGILIQSCDQQISSVREAQLATSRPVSDSEYADAQLAWNVCANIKSNAINIVKNQMLLAVGAGQMSRIDSVELALAKASRHGHDLNGAVCASDAFFPFPDSVEVLAECGIKVVIAPAGSLRDQAVIDKAEQLGLSLLLTADRHFKH